MLFGIGNHRQGFLQHKGLIFETERSDNIRILILDRYGGVQVCPLRETHLKYKQTCTVFIRKFLRKSLQGSGHSVPVEIGILKDRRMGCKERGAYFSLWCYVCTHSLAVSFCMYFLRHYTAARTVAVRCSPGIVYWCQTDSHRNHTNRKIHRCYFSSPTG